MFCYILVINIWYLLMCYFILFKEWVFGNSGLWWFRRKLRGDRIIILIWICRFFLEYVYIDE